MGIVRLYSDGSARGNPGPGGYGTILEYEDNAGVIHEKVISAGFRETTNNRMELMGCIAGFEALTRPCRVEVISDSKYLTDAFNQKWVDKWQESGWKRKTGPVKNIDLWKRLLEVMETHEVSFTWVKGHNDHPQNERCDKLATTAADMDNLPIDEGYEI